jgi:predicted transcriptional regulator
MVLTTLKIKQHYEPLNEFLDVEDPVWKAWRLMKNLKVKQLPVMKNEKIVGVVSDKDIVQISGFNGGQSMPVKEAMNLDPLIVQIDDTMHTVLQSMLKKDQQHAVVLNAQGEICGMFSWSSAFKFFLNFSDVNHLRQLFSN